MFKFFSKKVFATLIFFSKKYLHPLIFFSKRSPCLGKWKPWNQSNSNCNQNVSTRSQLVDAKLQGEPEYFESISDFVNHFNGRINLIFLSFMVNEVWDLIQNFQVESHAYYFFLTLLHRTSSSSKRSVSLARV